jgi:hypothetical protein
MLISLFPDTDGDAGLAQGKNVTIAARAVPFLQLDSLAMPQIPQTPQQPQNDPRASGAAAIAVGMMASLAVSSYLF